MRFEVPLLKGLVFVRRPVSDAPPEGTLCFVDDGNATGWKRGQSVGLFKDGEWTNGKGRALRFAPTYWTKMEDVPA